MILRGSPHQRSSIPPRSRAAVTHVEHEHGVGVDEPDHPEQQAAAGEAVLGGALLELHRVHLLLQRQTLDREADAVRRDRPTAGRCHDFTKLRRTHEARWSSRKKAFGNSRG